MTEQEARERFPFGAWLCEGGRVAPAANLGRRESHQYGPAHYLSLDTDEPCPECGGDLAVHAIRGDRVTPHDDEEADAVDCPTCHETGKADSILTRVKAGTWPEYREEP